MATTSNQFARPAPRQIAPRQTDRDRLLGSGFLLAALVTAMIGVAIGVGGYLWMSRPEVSPAVISATGPRGPEQPLQTVDGDVWTDADIRQCGAVATAAADVALKRKLAAVSADRVGLGGPEAAIVERTTYLLCSVRSKPLHLCNDYWRGTFIEALKAHALDFRHVISSAYWTKVNLADRARRDAAASHGELQTIFDDLDQTTREVAKMHEDITAALRALVADGIVAPGDFGVFFGIGIPPDIGAMIGDARAVRHLCG